MSIKIKSKAKKQVILLLEPSGKGGKALNKYLIEELDDEQLKIWITSILSNPVKNAGIAKRYFENTIDELKDFVNPKPKARSKKVDNQEEENDVQA
jgi:5S rRNA maturation endonuclease (ribonuclease M5)